MKTKCIDPVEVSSLHAGLPGGEKPIIFVAL